MGTVATVLALGPRVRFEEAWIEPTLPDDLDAWLAEAEAGVPDLRDGDERAIVWLDSEERTPTPLSIVYLHGFSADRHEMEPVISDLAAELGANLYFSRLAGHGRDRTAMAEATVEAWLADTAEALARLKQVALQQGNLFAELMNAVRVASLGQITHALYEVGGQYRRAM